MNEPRRPANAPEDDALFAYGDDPDAAPSNDLEATVRRLQHATGLEATLTTSIPTDLKHQIWEDLMNAQTAPLLPSPIARPTSRRAAELVSAHAPHTASSPRPDRSRLIRAVARWQPAVSLAVVVAFLVGLIGIAYQRGVLDEPAPPNPTGASGQAIPDDYNPRETPVVSGDCEPHGPRRLSNAELEAMALADWQDPIYAPAGPVPSEVGQAALDTYLGWFMCQRQFWYDGGTPAVHVSEDMLSFYSDRWQYISLAPSFADPREDEIAEFWRDNEAHIEEIIAGFPLPLNRVSFYFLDGTSVHFPGFQPGDVYRMPDDRYGAVIGSVSAEMMQTGLPTEFEDGLLWFVAFEEYDRELYIDEMFPLCTNGEAPVFDAAVEATPSAGASQSIEETELVCQ